MDSDTPFPSPVAAVDTTLDRIRDRIRRRPDRKCGARGPGTVVRTFDNLIRTIPPATRPLDHPGSLSSVSSALGAAGILAGSRMGSPVKSTQKTMCLYGPANSLAGHRPPGASLSRAESPLICPPSTRPASVVPTLSGDLDAGRPCAPPGRMPTEAARKILKDSPGAFAVFGDAGFMDSGAIDGACDLAAMVDPGTRILFDGIDRADSLIVDPRKWLLAPYDTRIPVYRNAADGRVSHRRQAPYPSALDDSGFYPSDHAIRLTRRARGLPFRFSPAVHGTEVYGKAVARTPDIARNMVDGIAATPGFEPPSGPRLTVIPSGRPPCQGKRWGHGRAEARRRPDVIPCFPMAWQGMKVSGLDMVNPDTGVEEVLAVVRTLRGPWP